VDDYFIAEKIVGELEKYLHRRRRKDLTQEEIDDLRRQYADWLRTQV
jgi:hypothetical protein